MASIHLVELPEKLLQAFGQMTEGLVAQVTVASLAALRKNTHRILRRLSPSLDAAYLWHRATQVHPIDAQEHLRSIVVDEMESVLVDDAVDSRADLDAIQAWMTVRTPVDSEFTARFGVNNPVTRADVVELLEKGVPSRGKHVKLPTLSVRTRKDRCFSESEESNTRANEKFAMLLSLQSHYRPPHPALTLGTILRLTATPATYWVCVQPVCDAVRLKDSTSFPLVPLVLPKDDEGFDIIVQADDAVLRLRLNSDPSRIHMERFTPNLSAGRVMASEENREAEKRKALWFFSADGGSRYDWLGELKPQHALAISGKVAAKLGRVGLVESEWLRRWHDRD